MPSVGDSVRENSQQKVEGWAIYLQSGEISSCDWCAKAPGLHEFQWVSIEPEMQAQPPSTGQQPAVRSTGLNSGPVLQLIAESQLKRADGTIM